MNCTKHNRRACVDCLYDELTVPIGAPMTESDIRAAKSKNHIGFAEHNGITYEYHVRPNPNGGLYRAPNYNVIDITTGFRHGRYECPPHMARQCLPVELQAAYDAWQKTVFANFVTTEQAK